MTQDYGALIADAVDQCGNYDDAAFRVARLREGYLTDACPTRDEDADAAGILALTAAGEQQRALAICRRATPGLLAALRRQLARAGRLAALAASYQAVDPPLCAVAVLARLVDEEARHAGL